LIQIMNAEEFSRTGSDFHHFAFASATRQQYSLKRA